MSKSIDIKLFVELLTITIHSIEKNRNGSKYITHCKIC